MGPVSLSFNAPLLIRLSQILPLVNDCTVIRTVSADIKSFAAMQGRDFTTPDDIREVVTPVLRHRIILAPDKEMEGITEDEVIKQIIQGMDVPR